MSSFKKLSKADVTTVPYAANKQWNLVYNGGINDEYAVYSVGINESFLTNQSVTANGQYQSLIYSEINHLFYQSYTDILDTGSLMFNINTYESASQQRPTASYFNYNNNPLLVKQFPTGASQTIGVLSINQSIFGSKILPNTFYISSSQTFIADDGYGNLYDIQGYQDDYLSSGFINSSYFSDTTPGVGPILVGNIFYAHGIVVVTNQASLYQVLFGSPTCTTYQLQSSVSQPFTASYIACDGTPTTSSITANTRLNVCVNNNYGSPTIISGNGRITNVGNCNPGSFLRTISFQNEHIIYENEIRCIVRESDFNLSYNPTLVTGSYTSGTLRDFATGSAFQPYVTTIGLYNDENELLMVAKLGKPIALSSDTDMTFIVKYDT
jgi:hypothetical protein